MAVLVTYCVSSGLIREAGSYCDMEERVITGSRVRTVVAAGEEVWEC